MLAWDKKMRVVRNVGFLFAVLVACTLLILIGKLINRGLDKALDAIF